LKFKAKRESNNYTWKVTYNHGENEGGENETKSNKHLAANCKIIVEVMIFILY